MARIYLLLLILMVMIFWYFTLIFRYPQNFCTIINSKCIVDWTKIYPLALTVMLYTSLHSHRCTHVLSYDKHDIRVYSQACQQNECKRMLALFSLLTINDQILSHLIRIHLLSEANCIQYIFSNKGISQKNLH